MKKKCISLLLAGAILVGTPGALIPSALAENSVGTSQAEAAQSLSVRPKKLWMKPQEQSQLTASVSPDVYAALTWSSSDPSVCSVSNDGTVTAQACGTAVISVQSGTLSDHCTIYIGLDAPILSEITTDDSAHAYVSWSSVDGCDGYRIYRRVSTSDSWQAQATLTGTEWTDSSAAVSGCQYAVRAYKLLDSQPDDSATIWSDYASGTLSSVVTNSAAPLSKPSTPVLISAESVSDKGNYITWNPVSNADGYRIYCKQDDQWTLIGIVNRASATGYTHRGVSPLKNYIYTVRAFCRSGGKIVLSDYDTTGVSVTAPTIPTPALDAVSSDGYDRLRVTWYASSRAEGYRIYRRSSDADRWEYLVQIDGSNSTSYTDTTVECGKTYYYTVCAYRSVSGSDIYSGRNDTGISGVAIPATPKLNGASSTSSSSIKVSWNAVSGSDGYHIYRKTGSSSSWTYIGYTTGGNAVTYTDTGLTTGQRYYYTVCAFHRCSDSSLCVGKYDSAGVSAVPAAAAAYSNVYTTYSTSYQSSNANRTTNLDIACKTINGTVVKPGESFSFNGKLGKRTSDKGYKPATIFTGTSGTAQEIGGGICQVASTMFNTALLANVTIKERYPHSQKVSYVPLGRDAGIYYGSKDFQFTNNSKYSIKIKSWISGGTLTVQFLTTEEVKPADVKLTVTYSSGTYTLKRSVNGTVNYTTKSTYG